MKFLFLSFLFLTAPLAAKATFQASDGFNREQIAFAVEDGLTDWNECWNLPVLDYRIVEYIPVGESLDNWSEMVTLQFLNSVETPENFLALFQEGICSQNESASFEVVESTPDALTWEWRISTPSPGGGVQHELCHLVRAKGGWFRIAYTKKVAKLSSHERSDWLAALQSAHLGE